ncbi:MAG: hypothetical protein RLZZ338_2167 [Cyanobacteriota bacterium]|jgi:Uma2 family endonuclease
MNAQILTEEIIDSPKSLTLYGVSWDKFKAIEFALDGISNVQLVYLDGIIDIMAPLSAEHEDAKSVIRQLIVIYLEEKGIRFYARGSPTLGSKELGIQKEPDESFNLHTKKEIPDLVLEVIVTSGGINTLDIYKRINVPEVLFWRKGKLAIYSLQEEEYKAVEKSELLPELNLDLLVRCANMEDQYDALMEFRKALQQ